MPSPTSHGRRALTRVRLSNDAFLAMAFSAAEAALIAPDFNGHSFRLLAEWEKERGTRPTRKAPLPPSLIFSETGHEVAGVLFGDVKHTKNQTTISLEWAMATTALSSDDGVAQSGASALLMDDLAVAAGKPFGSVVACWHSHPELTTAPRDVVDQELYAPSETDLDGPAYPNCAVSLILTVAWFDKTKSKPDEFYNLVSRRIGDFNFFLTAHLPSRNWCPNDPALQIHIRI